MEIKKILYALLIGIVLCFIFVGILKYAESKRTEGNGTNQVTTEPVVQASSESHEVPTKGPEIQLTQEPVSTTTAFIESVEETREPTEEPAEQPTESPKESVGESEQQISQLPVETVIPTMVPTLEPSQKKKEIPTVQNTPLPASPTKAPQETQAPIPQSTQSPSPTKEPIVEEEVHVHEFEKAIWELPTCQKGGYYNNICKTCGFEECVTQEPLPHQVKDVMIQEGNCMEDRVIRHICTECEKQIGSDTRYPLYDVHQWGTEEVDGVLVEYCERCGVVK